MIYPDTSFLCSLYRKQSTSLRAVNFHQGLGEKLAVSSLLLLEFRQSIRFQMRLFANDRSKGFSKSEATAMLRALNSDLASEVLRMVAPDWADVHRIAEVLSGKYTETNGHRLVDILHVATALHFGAAQFLTFDAHQKRLAEAEGMQVPV